jgi:hypothetical protein
MKTKRWRSGISALFMAAMILGTDAAAQLPAPLLQAIRSADRSQLALQLSSQAGWYYTWLTSRDLGQWTWLGAAPGNASSLSWTDAIAPQVPARFYRVKVSAPHPVVVTNYHGWTNAIFVNNGQVEAIVVPAAGRVLQFRFLGSTNGPFWENPLMYGQAANASIWNTEGAFGGDKAWPSPQSDWNWPPPVGFDGSTNAYSISNGVVTLQTPVDSTYRVRTTRVVDLGYDEPVMRIRTIFERTAATTLTNRPMGVWVITQTADPISCYVPVPTNSIFTNGYTQLGSGQMSQFRYTNGLISFTRDKSASHKLGFDAGTLLWVGTNFSLRIDAPRVAGLAPSAYPDSGSSTEAYTNPTRTAAYVELELLGPLSTLPVGGRLEFLTTYTLFTRTQSTPDLEARAILNRP